MTTTSPNNLDVEDIFAGSDDDLENIPVTPVTDSQSAELTPEAVMQDMQVGEPASIADAEDVYDEPTMRRPFNWRIVIIVAIIVGGLLLIAGIVAGGYYWYTQRNTIVEDSINNVNVIINTNGASDSLTNNSNIDIVNVNETPANDSNGAFVDSDHDGLSDEEERVNNTNPLKKDTDEDGLSDREEVRVYLTDPRNSDTDGDGFIDGEEVANFYHPNHPDPKQRLFELPQDN